LVFRGYLVNVLAALGLVAGASGCNLIVPTVAQRPVIRNPFPQLRRVAVAPFFNQSDEPTVDGRQVALAYFSALQSTPGFEVVPLGVVEEAIIEHRIDLAGANEARRLAQILEVDAVAVGSVTDFSEYYPPRLGLRVEWYAANPGFHEIPAGYGLPWDTPEEEFIPDSLVYESQMALARQQMSALTPDCESAAHALPAPPAMAPAAAGDDGAAPTGDDAPGAANENGGPPAAQSAQSREQRLRDERVKLAQAESDAPSAGGAAMRATSGATGAIVTTVPPCATGECSATACAADAAVLERPDCLPHYGPVLSHTRIYHGDDAELTEALEGYVFFRDDSRFGGWKSYLSRSDDFVRFCCHMHICEMLSARGGSRKTQVVWRWPESR
jgi:hypothetical protein